MCCYGHHLTSDPVVGVMRIPGDDLHVTLRVTQLTCHSNVQLLLWGGRGVLSMCRSYYNNQRERNLLTVLMNEKNIKGQLTQLSPIFNQSKLKTRHDLMLPEVTGERQS